MGPSRSGRRSLSEGFSRRGYNWAVDPEAPIDTERLRLEPLLPEHAAELFPVLDDDRLHGFTGGRPATLEELRTRYGSLEDRRSPDGKEQWLNWVVRERASDAAIGTVQATIVGDRALVAWVIGSGFQGEGFASEAARALVEVLLDDPAIQTVTALVAPGHVASEKVAARAGLTLTDELVDGERVWTASDH
jgi:RimJ/RimL family protein N-acetyltransferase